LAERTLYEFRRRVYRYTVENPDKDDLIFGQTDSLKQVLEPEYKTKVLYRSRGSEAQKRLQEILDLGLELVSITEANPDVRKLNTIAILQRFINEQAIFDGEKNAWKAKANQDIGANSLQESLRPGCNLPQESL
jgi:hypothetical protein